MKTIFEEEAARLISHDTKILRWHFNVGRRPFGTGSTELMRVAKVAMLLLKGPLSKLPQVGAEFTVLPPQPPKSLGLWVLSHHIRLK